MTCGLTTALTATATTTGSQPRPSGTVHAAAFSLIRAFVWPEGGESAVQVLTTSGQVLPAA